MQSFTIFLIFFLFLTIPLRAAGQGFPAQENMDFQQQRLEHYERQIEYALEHSRAINSGRAYNGYSDTRDSANYPGRNFGNPSNTSDPYHQPAAYDPIGGRSRVAPGNAPAARPLTNNANQLTQAMLMVMPVEPSPAYDEDGNLIAAPADIAGSAATVLRYDGENRLKSVEPKTPVDGSTKVEYVYDYMGRRAAKKDFTYSSGSWSLTSSSTFVYDGWNLVKEIKSPEPRTQPPESSYYVWGLDLSGTLQGAGGIGGLLARVKGDSVQRYTYDGNGNVSELVNADGSIAAHYEYDPFGISLTATASDNPFRFSTKYLDAETGLYYYGYRYYSTTLGRWINRDPSGENGGINLYAFVTNSPITYADLVGLALYAFDGTGNDANDPREMPTHIRALYDMYKSPENRKKFYMPGVGVRSMPKRQTGMVLGHGGLERIDSMFGLFEQTYADGMGDTEVDIIGFSRGAAMAREFVNRIYDKDRCIKIRFLGLFDTVSQMSGVRLNIPPNVEYVAHAVAMNEFRDWFPLTSIMKAYGGSKNYGMLDYQTFKGKNYWEESFPGSHSDIGGGYDEGSNLGALWWMYDAGRSRGVPFDDSLFIHIYQDTDKWHDSRYPFVDRIPFMSIGRNTRTIYSGNIEP